MDSLFFLENSIGQLILSAFIVLAAAYAHGVLGLGFVSVAMPILVLLISFRSAMVLTVPVAFFLTARMTFFGSKTREVFRIFWPLPFFMIWGGLTGSWIFQNVSTNVLLWIISGALFLFLSVDLLRGNLPQLPERWVMPVGMLAAFLAGNTEASVNMGAPFLLLFSLLTSLSTQTIVQVFNLCFFTGKALQFVTLSVGGQNNPSVGLTEWIPGLLLVPVAILLCNRGILLRERISVDTYRQWLKGILFLVATVLLGQLILDGH